MQSVPLQNVAFWGETLRLLVELAATAAFALSGVLEGARKRLDVVGVCVVGFLTAFGGGTLRDLLLDQRPFFWVRHVEMLWGALALHAGHAGTQSPALCVDRTCHPVARRAGPRSACRHRRAPALLLQMPALVAVLMGLITGVFGGVLRDVVCNEIPTAFHDHRPYAVCAFAGGWVYVGLRQIDAPAGWRWRLAS